MLNVLSASLCKHRGLFNDVRMSFPVMVPSFSTVTPALELCICLLHSAISDTSDGKTEGEKASAQSREIATSIYEELYPVKEVTVKVRSCPLCFGNCVLGPAQ